MIFCPQQLPLKPSSIQCKSMMKHAKGSFVYLTICCILILVLVSKIMLQQAGQVSYNLVGVSPVKNYFYVHFQQ